MALDFPNSPINGQVYTVGSRSWQWNVVTSTWDSISVTQGIQGIQGTTGIQGNQGTQGIQGNQGTTGIQGNQGTQGIQGVMGFQGIIQGTVAPATSMLWLDTSVAGISDTTVGFNQVTSSYTLTLPDAGKMVELNSATGVTLTVPLNSTAAFVAGTQINILQTGAGQVSVVGAGGVTINATPGSFLRTQWSSATLLKRSTDTWVLIGDLA
jgi:hypothetical protein